VAGAARRGAAKRTAGRRRGSQRHTELAVAAAPGRLVVNERCGRLAGCARRSRRPLFRNKGRLSQTPLPPFAPSGTRHLRRGGGEPVASSNGVGGGIGAAIPGQSPLGAASALCCFCAMPENLHFSLSLIFKPSIPEHAGGLYLCSSISLSRCFQLAAAARRCFR